jgi:hypothetical protein
MYQIHVPQVGSQLLHWFLWCGINLHIQVQSFVPKPPLHIQKALTFCNIELAKAIANVHHIDQPKSMHFMTWVINHQLQTFQPWIQNQH